MADQTPPRRIPRDDSFKTCKAELPSPTTRRQLRMTPARNSILSGGKPYKESSSKKFNSRRKHNISQKDDTVGSNDTFIRCEQDCQFDGDSLEMEQKFQAVSIEPTLLKDQNHNNQDNALPETSPIKEKVPSPPKRRDSIRRYLQKVKTPAKTKSSSPKKNPPKQRNNLMLPPPMPASILKSNAKTNRSAFVTPKIAFRKPANLLGTASRYLSSCKSTRITRTQSFKSTAELERDYFSSLRSF